jgi:hypothetical protein
MKADFLSDWEKTDTSYTKPTESGKLQVLNKYL